MSEPRKPGPLGAFYADERQDVRTQEDEFVEIVWRVPRAFYEASMTGVQHVVTTRDDGKLQVLYGDDVYLAMPSGDIIKTNDPMAQLLELGIAKLGVWVPDKIFRAAQERANEWRNEQAERLAKK